MAGSPFQVLKNLLRNARPAVAYGAALLMLFVSVSYSFAGADMTVFGPKRYDRLKGKPTVYTDTFERCNPSDLALIRVQNGDSKNTRIKSARIYINGSKIAGESEFKHKIATFEKLVAVQQLNELKVILKSGHHGYFDQLAKYQARQSDLEKDLAKLRSLENEIAGLKPPYDIKALERILLEFQRIKKGYGDRDEHLARVRKSLDDEDDDADDKEDGWDREKNGHEIGTDWVEHDRTGMEKSKRDTEDAIRSCKAALDTFDRSTSRREKDHEKKREKLSELLKELEGINRAIDENARHLDDLARKIDEIRKRGPSFLIIEIIGKGCDSTPPVISAISPADGALLNNPLPVISASYADEANGSGINPASVRLLVDGNDVSVAASITAAAISYTPGTKLPDGSHAVSLSVDDRAANVASRIWSFVTDTVPPVVTISAPASGLLTRNSKMTVTGTVSEDVTAVTVNNIPAQINGKDWTLVDYTLSEGANSITVQATDRAGNPGSATVNVTLDSTPPAAPLLNTLTTPTSQAVVTISGTAEAAAGVKIFAAGVLTGTVPADAEGKFSLAGVTLVEGTNTYTATATDAAGNESSPSSPVSAVLDITPPVVTITAPTANAFLNTPQITVTGTVSEPVTSVTVNNTPAVVDGLSFSLTTTLAEGANTLAIKAMDLAGNEGTASALVYLDTIPPQVTIVTPAAGLLTRDKQVTVSGTVSEEFTTVTVNTITATVSGSNWTTAYTLSEEANAITVKATDRAGNSGSATVNVTLDSTPPQAPVLTPLVSPTNVAGVTLGGTAEAGSSVKISAAGLPVGTVTADVQGNFTLPGVTLAEGTNSYTATATDAAGNESLPSVPLGIVLDTRAPVITVTAPAENAFFSAPQVTVKGNIDEPVASLTINGQAATLSSLDFEQPLTLTPGLNTITLVATDLAGNQATKTVFVTLDNTPPVVTITAPLSGTITKTAQVTVSGTISKPNTTATINGTAITVTNQTFNVVYTLAEGDNILNIEAIDRAGNKGSAGVGVSLDSQSPILSLQSPAEAAAGANVAIMVNASDNRQLTIMELKADGVPIWSGGNAPSIAESVSYRLSPSLNTGSEVVFQARGIDVAGNEGSATTRVKITQAAMGPGYVQGKVLEDERGLLLADAQVTVTNENGEVKTLTTAADGGYFTENRSGSAVVGIIKPGFTSVERIVPVMPEKKAMALDARLTKINGAKNVVDALGGSIRVDVGAGLPRPAIELTIPNSALSDQADIRLTPVSNQGLAGLLPPGWSPLAAVDVRLLDPTAGTALYSGFSSAAALKIPLQVPLAQSSGAVLTLAAYDSTSHQWRSKGNATIATDGLSASADITAAGQYALLIADPAPNTPAAAEAGNPLAPASMASLDYAAINTAGKVVPQASPPSTGLKAAGEVLLTAKDGVTPAPQFISGFVINNRVTEKFDLKSGDKVEPSAYTQDIVLYSRPCITNIAAGTLTEVSGATLRTTFPVSPSRDFTLVDLLLGKVGIEIVKPDATDSGVMVGADGGRLVDADGNILVIPQGALSQTTPVATKNGAAATGAVGNDFTLLKVVDVNLTRQTLAQSATISISSPAGLDPALPLIVAKQIDVKGVARLKLVALGKQSGSLISSDTAASGITLPGITTSGLYYFLQAKGQIGFATGTVTDSSNATFNGALVKTDNGSLIDLSAATGKYLVAAPVAAVTATATDLYKNDEGSATGAIAVNQAIIIDLKILMILPTVVSVSPTGINIQPNAPVVITFSKSMDQNSINSQTLKLLDSAGTAVPGVFTFSVDGKVVTFTPAELLKSQQSYTVTVAGTIKDLQGYPLGQDVTSGFTIRNTTPPPMPPAGSITASFPDADGFITVTATQGSAATDNTVLLINDTTGEIVSIKPASNGSFSGRVRGQLGDEIKVMLMDASGNQTLVSYITFKSDDGKYLVTAKGGKVEGEGGSVLEIPEGALVGPTVIKMSIITEADLPHPVQEGASFVAGVNIDTGGMPFQKEVQFSVPLPAGYQADKTPFVATPDTLVNADGTEEKVFVIVDSAKVVDGRLSTACAPFGGVMTPGFLAFFQFPYFTAAIVSGYTYKDMDGDNTFTSGVDLPVKNAVIRAPGSWNYVSYSNSSGFYATYSTVIANIGGDCRDYSVTAINPQTMYRKTINTFICEPPYNIKRLNFKLAEKNSTFPDKTPPLVNLNLQVAPGQPPEARFTAGTVPVGTDMELAISVIEQEMGTVTLTVQGPDMAFPLPVQLNQEGSSIHTVLSPEKPAIYRYTYSARFTDPIKGSLPVNFRPGAPGVYTIVVEAKDAAGNRSRQSKQIRAVVSGTTPAGIDGPPVILTVSPDNSAEGVMVTTPVTVFFSEPVDNVTTDTFRLIDTTTGLQVPATVFPSIENGKMKAVLTPNGNLSYSRKYEIVLTQGITDSNPNPSAGDTLLPLNEEFHATFTTKVPKAYDLPAADQSPGGRDIALYTNPETGRTYAYITAMDNGWLVADVTDPTQPFITQNVNYLSRFSFRYLAVEPQQRILAMTESVFSLQYGMIRFYDLTGTPQTPREVGRERLSEEWSGVPSRVAISGKYAYVATLMVGVQVVDIDIAKENVSSGRSSSGKAIVGALDMIGENNNQPWDIVLYGAGRGLLTTSKGYLLTLDLSTPEAPQIMNSFHPEGYIATRAAAASEYAYVDADGVNQVMDLAVTAGTLGAAGKINTVDISDPYNPRVIGTAIDDQRQAALVIANEITINKEAGLAFVANYNSILVIDVKNPFNPRLINEIKLLPDVNGNMIPIGASYGVVEKDGLLYSADYSKGLRVVALDPHYLKIKPTPLVLSARDRAPAVEDVQLDFEVYPDEGFTPVSAALVIYEDQNEIWKKPIPREGRGTVTYPAVSQAKIFDSTKKYEAAIRLVDAANMVSEGANTRIPLQWPILSTDYDHNGKIEDSDRQLADKGEVFRFWVNDDDDSGETEGTDIPGKGSNGTDNIVNGVRDLIDFFPVHIDLMDLASKYDPARYLYQLRCDKSNINIVETDLFADRSGEYLTGDENSLDPALALKEAKTKNVTANGITLSPAFVKKAKDINNQNAGVILVEGRSEGECNLTLKILDKDQPVYTSQPLTINLTGVEQMFRHRNLTQAGVLDEEPARQNVQDFAPGLRDDNGVPDRFDVPNSPNLEGSSNFVFVHGYNVNGKQARGWHAEMFKRMYWSGSKARFWGVTWYGWRSQLWLPLLGEVAPNYWINVRQALKTAPALKQFIDSLGGNVTVAAHSLGNMVVSSAIKDHNANVGRYYMINAAVPTEALYGAEKAASEMLVADWDGYNPILWASEWYRRFSDARSQLTWRDRLSNGQTGKYYNFFSPGEDVLSDSWRTQERLKGTFNLFGLNYGGWGFNIDDYYELTAPSCDGCPNGKVRWPVARANAIADEELKTKPFFKRGGPIEDLVVSSVIDGSIVARYKDRVLAEAFPALTSAVGMKANGGLALVNNLDMQNNLKTNKKGTIYWPQERTRDKDWKHSDLKSVAYPYVFGLFDNIVQIGGLK